MIYAKPLKRKDLGPMPEPEIDSNELTEQRHSTDIVTTLSRHSKTKENYGFDKKVILPSEIKEVVYSIVRDNPGIRGNKITHKVKEFISRTNCFERNPAIEYGYQLRLLEKEGRINKLSMRDKYGRFSLYYRRID